MTIERLGSYRLGERLGKGGMGQVFRAVDERSGKAIALKLLSDDLVGDVDARRRFLREAKIGLASATDPRVVQVIDVVHEADTLGIAMELVDGPSLEELVRRSGPLTERVALDYLMQVVDALGRMAARGMIHRDVKPANILVSSTLGVKLTDFGLARCMSESTRITRTDQVMGSPAYMSPEQAQGSSDVDHRSDIYSLGATLHFMLSGRTPFRAPHTAAMVLCHLQEPPPDLAVSRPGTSARVAGLVKWMMAKATKDRPRDYDAVRREAEACLQAAGPAAVDESQEQTLPVTDRTVPRPTPVAPTEKRGAALPVLARLKRRIRVKSGLSAALAVAALMVTADPSGMVFVPPGEYVMTAGPHPRKLHIDAPFWIDRHEVTEAQFARFDAKHPVPRGQDQHPVTRVKDDVARAYAASVGKRLPTDTEWQVAARGPAALLYPWGNEAEAGAANLLEGAEGGPRAVGSFPRDCSGFGCYDMAGNVREFTWDGTRTNIMGGSFREQPHEELLDPPVATAQELDEVGFRCVKDHGLVERAGRGLALALIAALIGATFWFL